MFKQATSIQLIQFN